MVFAWIRNIQAGTVPSSPFQAMFRLFGHLRYAEMGYFSSAWVGTMSTPACSSTSPRGISSQNRMDPALLPGVPHKGLIVERPA
jgi:hypothetical protein